MGPDSFDPAYVPKDYDEFCRLYYKKIHQQILGFTGIDYQEVDDLTQIMFMQFVEGDYLNIYSIDRQHQYADERYANAMVAYESGDLLTRPTKNKGLFSSFVFEFVKRRLLGMRDRQNRKQMKEGTSIDAMLQLEEDGSETQQTLLSYLGRDDGEFLTIELRQVINEVHMKLQEYTQASPTRNLAELFQTMVTATFTEQEGFNKEAYAASKGITPSAVSMQIKDMREYIYGFGFKKQLKGLFVERSRLSIRNAYR